MMGYNRELKFMVQICGVFCYQIRIGDHDFDTNQHVEKIFIIDSQVILCKVYVDL